MYSIFFDYNSETIRLPVNPPEISVNVRSKNKTVELVNLGEANITKLPGLIEIEMKILLPAQKYHFIHTLGGFREPVFYLERFALYKAGKKPVRLILNRELPNGETSFDMNLEVVLEDYSYTERGGEPGDIWVDLKLNEYKKIRAEVYTIPESELEKIVYDHTVKISKQVLRPSKETEKTYETKEGDTAWSIAKKELNDGGKHTQVANAGGISSAAVFSPKLKIPLQPDFNEEYTNQGGGGSSNGGGFGRTSRNGGGFGRTSRNGGGFAGSLNQGGGGSSNGGGFGRKSTAARDYWAYAGITPPANLFVKNRVD